MLHVAEEGKNTLPWDHMPGPRHLSLLNLFEPTKGMGPASTPRCIAITGSGGKTSLLQVLAHALPHVGWGMVTTTTTHIMPPNNFETSPLCSAGLLLAAGRNMSDVAAELAIFFSNTPCGHLTMGWSLESGKVQGLSSEHICCVRDMLTKIMGESAASLCLLVEADGAARHPLKAHAGHEPAIPTCADVTIAVAGLDALGKPLKEVVHRPELAAKRLGCPSKTVVSPDIMADLLLYPQGPFRDSPPSRAVLLNKADAVRASDVVAVTQALALREPKLPCHVGSLHSGCTWLNAPSCPS